MLVPVPLDTRFPQMQKKIAILILPLLSLSISSTSALMNSSTILKHTLRRGRFSIHKKTFNPSCQKARFYSSCIVKRHSKTSGEPEGSNSSVAFSTAAMTVTLTGGAAVTCLEESNGSTVNCEGGKPEVFPEKVIKYDTYNGVTLKVANLGLKSDSEEKFGTMLENSLRLWKEDGKRGIWMHVPTEDSSVVPILTKAGFEFQYAKKGLLVLTKVRSCCWEESFNFFLAHNKMFAIQSGYQKIQNLGFHMDQHIKLVLEQ